MTGKWRMALVVAAFGCWCHGAEAATITFDLETVSFGAFMPFTQSVGGATATFSSPGAFAYTIATPPSAGLTLSQFSGQFVNPTSAARNALDIRFSQLIDSITLTFATNDFHTPTTLQLTAFVDSVGNPPVGSATAKPLEVANQLPQGPIAFSSATPFNLVRLLLPLQTGEPATAFLVDNIVVNTADVTPPAIPEPGTLVLLGLGLSCIAARRRSRR